MNWTRVQELFNQALVLPCSERASFVSRAASDEREVLLEVLQLLEAHNRASGFLQQPAVLPTSPGTSQSILVDKSPGTPPNIREHKRFRRLVIVVGFAILFLTTWTEMLYMRPPAAFKSFGWHAAAREGAYTITEVSPGGPAEKKLYVGDKIVAINGDRRVALAGPRPKLDSLPNDRSSYVLQVQSVGGGERILTLTYAKLEPRSVFNLNDYVSLLMVPIMVVLMAFVGYAKPDLITAKLCFGCFSVLSLFSLVDRLAPFRTDLPFLLVVVKELLTSTFGLDVMMAYFFAAHFPVPIVASRRWKALSWVIAVGAAIIFLPRFVLAWVRAFGEDVSLNFGQLFWPLVQSYSSTWSAKESWYLSVWDEVFYSTCIISIFAVLCRNRQALIQPDQRRRLQWFNWGVILGTAPTLLLIITVNLDARLNSAQLAASGALAKLQSYCRWAIMLVPFTIAYTILCGKVVGVDFIARRGLQYVLAKNVLRCLFFLPLTGSVVLLMRNPDLTIAEFFRAIPGIVSVLLTICSGLGLAFHAQLNMLVDRVFFPERHSQECMLKDLVQLIRAADSLTGIGDLIKTEIARSLRPECVLLYFRKSEHADFLLLSSSICSPVNRIQRSDPIISMIAAGESVQSPPLGKEVKVYSSGSHEQTAIELIIPVFCQANDLSGMIFLGPKQTQELYTKIDKELLSSIAEQIGRLHLAVALQERTREQSVLQHEILIHNEKDILRDCSDCKRCFGSGSECCPFDGTKLTVRTAIPKTIDDRYRLDIVIGSGGMGVVFGAMDLLLNRSVALKVMLTNGSEQGLRAKREAQATARLRHPNIVTVYDTGTIGAHAAYLVMERIGGKTWREELVARKIIPPSLLALMLDQVLAAAEAAHSAGITHRDLKPENLLIYGGPLNQAIVKVVDFGVAKLDAVTNLTPTGMIFGTSGYIAPEAYDGLGDERSDLFSIGVVAVESLTGVNPFEGQSNEEILSAKLRREVKLPIASASWRRVESVLQKALAKDPGMRFQTAAAMRSEIVPALSQCLSQHS